MKRKCVLFMHLSLDGYATDLKDALDWIPYDDELEKYAEEVIAEVGTPVYGRKTYELMKSFWPDLLKDPSASKHDRDHARWIENVQKIVLSKTLKDPDWNNTRVISDHIVDEITDLKEQEGQDLVIFGSPTAAKSLLKLGLIDELLLTICPTILGEGKSIFEDGNQRIQLRLLKSRTFASGVISARYEIVK